ncbi:MAG: tetratricopeptide repeat protein [Rhodocyclales bacterium]|nr:tetratricopeptide repeat protein [Rhodocyclales bacterium]
MTKFRGWLWLLLAGLASTAALADATSDLRALVEQGRYQEAYELGNRHAERFGDPDFDFYFGIAAIDAGKAGDGLLALERCLIQVPGNPVVRAELARAYFTLGEDQRAREEFDAVLKAEPSDAVRRAIGRYLDALAAREARRRPGATFFVDAGLGSDSNVNGGVTSASISLPVYGDVMVAPGGVRKSDNFASLAIGGQATRPLTPEWSLVGGVGFDGKFNQRHSEADLLTTSFNVGAARRMADRSYRIAVGQDVVSVGSDRYRSANLLATQWQRQLDPRQALLASLHFADYAYTGFNHWRDANFYGLGVGYRRAFALAWQPALQVAINIGQEDNRKNRPDLGRDTAGLRLVVATTPAPDWTLAAGLSYQLSRYSAPDLLLASRRQDGYAGLDLTLGYAFDPRLSIRAEVLVSENRSNIALYDYRRDVAAVKLRYEFK